MTKPHRLSKRNILTVDGVEDITLCGHCNCMTKSIRVSKANFKCGKCGKDKNLGDLFQYNTFPK